MIAIKYRHILTARVLERMIDISCLCMRVIVARHVLHANLCGKLPEFLSPTIIEQEDSHFYRGIVQCHCCQHGSAYDVERFIICGYEHIDRWPIRMIVAERRGRAFQRAKSLEIAQYQR